MKGTWCRDRGRKPQPLHWQCRAQEQLFSISFQRLQKSQTYGIVRCSNGSLSNLKCHLGQYLRYGKASNNPWCKIAFEGTPYRFRRRSTRSSLQPLKGFASAQPVRRFTRSRVSQALNPFVASKAPLALLIWPHGQIAPHSHSMVPGGLLVTS